MSSSPELSVIVPVKDEEENIFPMVEEIRAASAQWPWSWELVFVDDGSTDFTWQKILEAKKNEPRIRAVRFKKNCGQTSGVTAGVRHARGRVCVTLDGDCQNDPADIVKLVKAMEDADMVMGWRKTRNDSAWRRFQSRLANNFRNALTGETVHDIGCAIKAFDRQKMLDVPLFEGMHRFMPTLFRYKGWKVIEVEVNHRARTRGITKYGMWNRAFKALRDLFAVRWMARRMIRYELKSEDTID
ncbi:glycosyltransferase family 2 protein [Candidatus Sumerlaeota bacterium]|nr:glycosyltransferase family 2 protein [Candidatus Sumerlaeota bacterium]